MSLRVLKCHTCKGGLLMTGKGQKSYQPARLPRKRVLKTAGQSESYGANAPRNTFWCTANKKGTGSSQDRVTDGKLCLTNLAGFCKQMSGYADKV